MASLTWITIWLYSVWTIFLEAYLKQFHLPILIHISLHNYLIIVHMIDLHINISLKWKYLHFRLVSFGCLYILTFSNFCAISWLSGLIGEESPESNNKMAGEMPGNGLVFGSLLTLEMGIWVRLTPVVLGLPSDFNDLDHSAPFLVCSLCLKYTSSSCHLTIVKHTTLIDTQYPETLHCLNQSVWPTLAVLMPDTFNMAVMIFSTGVISHGLGKTDGNFLRTMSNWHIILFHMGADDSREIQLMYIDKLFSNNIMLSDGKFFLLFSP